MNVAVSPDRVTELKTREDAAFAESHRRSLELRDRARSSMPLGVPLSWMAYLYDHAPLFVDSGDGATFTDVDGHRYIDMSLGITSAGVCRDSRRGDRAGQPPLRRGELRRGAGGSGDPL